MFYKNKEYKTIGEIFETPINFIKEGKKDEAMNFFKEYIRWIREQSGVQTEIAESIAKGNFAYFAGYYDKPTRDLVSENFGYLKRIF